MLNYIALKDQQELIVEFIKPNQVIDTKLITGATIATDTTIAGNTDFLKKKIGFKSYAHSQVLSFKYFGWLQKKS